MTVFSDIHIIEYVLILLAVVFMTVAIVLLTYHVVLLYIYAIAISRACDRSITGKCSRNQRNREDGTTDRRTGKNPADGTYIREKK